MQSERGHDWALPANETFLPFLTSLSKKMDHISGSNLYTARKYVKKATRSTVIFENVDLLCKHHKVSP